MNDTEAQEPTPAAEKVDLGSLIDTSATSKEATVEYADGFKIRLRYVGKAQLQTIGRACQVFKFDKKTKQRIPQLDTDAFMRAFANNAVVGWEGATPEVLSNIVPMKIDHLTEEQRQEEIPFSIEHIMLLLEHALDFDGFLQEQACDLTLFRPSFEDEAGNSESSPNGS